MSLRNASEQLDKEPESTPFDCVKIPLAIPMTNRDESTKFPIVPTGESGFEQSGAIHSFLEHLMTYSFAILLMANLYVAIGWLHGHGRLWALLIVAPLSWALADFITGLVHWFADTYGSEKTPVLGSLIKPFRLHHIYPRDICNHNLAVTIGNSCLLAVPVLCILLYAVATDSKVSIVKAILATGLTLLATGTVVTNVFHRWAHAEKTSRVVQLLQGCYVILGRDHHELHHARPFSSNYCITVGWLNHLLDRISFFRRLETVLAKLGLNPADDCLHERRQ